MATTLYFREAAAGFHRGRGEVQDRNLRNTEETWIAKALSTSRGAAATTAVTNTVAGATAGLEITKTAGAADCIEFISDPVDQDFTMSGSITWNLRAAELSMTANVAINAIVYRLRPGGSDNYARFPVDQTARVTELVVTTETAVNFAETPGAGVAFLKGDRILIRVYGDDAGTMGTGENFTFWYDGPTPAASGDSYVTFTETFAFETTTPAGTQLFLTDTVGPTVHGSRDEKEMWTSRGGGVTSVTSTARLSGLLGNDSYGNEGTSVPKDYLDPGTLPMVFRSGEAVGESQTAETTTIHTPALNTTTDDIGAQSFTPASGAWVYLVGVWTETVGGSGTSYTFQIRTDNGSDRPSATVLAENASMNVIFFKDNAETFMLADGWTDWDIFPLGEGAEISASTKYWLYLLTNPGNATNYAQTRGADGSSDNYASGSRIYSTDGGSVWTQPANEDWGFKVYTGRILEWYSKRVNAFTLGDLVRVNVRVAGSDADTGMAPKAVLWVVDNDGSNPVLWGIGQFNDAAGGEVTASEVAYTFDIAGDDLAVTDGQRLRFRVYVDGTPTQFMVQNNSATLYYAGTSGGASGDSYIQLSQSVSEYAPSTLVLQQGFVDHGDPGVL